MPTQTRIVLRSPREILKLRAAGLVVWAAHQEAYRIIRPGITTRELNAAVRRVLADAQAVPLFLNYPGPVPFPAESCISVNEELVHGIPGPRKLKEGDVVSIDIGARVGGWCGDAAVTYPVGEINSSARRLLQATKHALDLAIGRMSTAKRWSEVADDMDAFIRAQGLCMVDVMVGHGIGREMHEPPQIPNYRSQDWSGDFDFELRPGLVLAIEPMVNMTTPELKCLADQWTMVAADGKFTAHFEHTVALTDSGPVRLTDAPSEGEFALVPERFRNANSWVRW